MPMTHLQQQAVDALVLDVQSGQCDEALPYLAAAVVARTEAVDVAELRALAIAAADVCGLCHEMGKDLNPSSPLTVAVEKLTTALGPYEKLINTEDPKADYPEVINETT